jgi:hypothetical protein
LTSNKLLNPPKTLNIDRFSKTLKKDKHFLPHTVNDFLSKRNQTEGYLRPKIELSSEIKRMEP